MCNGNHSGGAHTTRVNHTASTKKGFFKRKNIEFSLKRYGIEALGAMALGLFASLIVGLILNVLGEQLHLPMIQDLGGRAMSIAGPAIGVAVAYGLKSPSLVLLLPRSQAWVDQSRRYETLTVLFATQLLLI